MEKLETVTEITEENVTHLRKDNTYLSNNDTMTKTELYLLVFEYLQSFEYVICFLVNLLTISAVVKFDYLHKKSTNILILCLSIADGCLGRVS